MLPPDRLTALPICIAGVGAVGRQVALQLAAAGARNICMYDHDYIEEVNLGPQGWKPRDLGRPKVYALQEELADFHGTPVGFTAFQRRLPVELAHPNEVLFCCVDGIETRGRIFAAHCGRAPLFLDSRVAADVVHILSACDADQYAYYPTTLFSDSDAFRGTCTTKMSIHIANIAAGLLIQQLSKWLRNKPLDRHVVFNFLAMESFCK